jgi:hypothetical protein
MGQLLTEAKEEGDDEFWGQDAFAEACCLAAVRVVRFSSGAPPRDAPPPLVHLAQDAVDDEYKSEAEEADQFDSDFNESEARCSSRGLSTRARVSRDSRRRDSLRAACCAARLARRVAPARNAAG